MPEPFKNLFSKELMHYVSDAIAKIHSDFDQQALFDEVFDETWEEKEFKERMHHMADAVRARLSDNFDVCLEEIYQMMAYFKAAGADQIKYAELAYIFFPDIVERYGMDHFDASVEAFEKITPFASCEFAVRPFIINHPSEMMKHVQQWTQHENEHVRRLASEGSRSRLPWGMAIPAFKDNPEPLLPVLEALKNDPSEYVRKSVANNLNDISKDNPDRVIGIAKAWKGESKHTDWIVKHACRTLLKAGNTEVLQLFGFCPPDKIEISNFSLLSDTVQIDGDLKFHFNLTNKSSKAEKIRLEYAVYYMKKNGTLSPKVYKISEKDYAPHSETAMTRKQSFKLITTRKFHTGQHMVSLIINGVEVEERTFELVE